MTAPLNFEDLLDLIEQRISDGALARYALAMLAESGTDRDLVDRLVGRYSGARGALAG
jgi:hypothetical protein